MIPDYMPSPHPLLVHFPIVLLIAAALLDLAAVVMRSRRLRDLTTWVLVAGTLSLPVTYWTGTIASDRVSSPFAETVGAMSEHAGLQLVAAGEHLRGYVDGELVVHGHADPAADGPAGLIVEGTGMVRLEMIRVRPVDD